VATQRSDEGGATVVGYAIIVCVIALVAVALVASGGLSAKAAFKNIGIMADAVIRRG
jgi:Flp pilus assembly pilin Flp